MPVRVGQEIQAVSRQVGVTTTGFRVPGSGFGGGVDTVVVAAGVIRDVDDRMLLAQRPVGKHLAGLWEFPGGKCEPGESAHDALARELEEEVGIHITESRPLLSLTHAYPEKTVRLLIREVRAWRGQPHGREGQPLQWVSLDQAASLPMPEADRPMLKMLAVEPRHVITPDVGEFGSLETFVAYWQQCLDAGFRFLQLRAPSLCTNRLVDLAERCGDLARARGARWLLDGPADLAVLCGADGVHLSASSLARTRQRPLPENMLVGASCHDANELTRAGEIGADFVCLSSARSTTSYSQAQPMDWSGFASLCAKSPLPVMAVGGVRPDDLGRSREAGGFGVAGMFELSK